MAENIALEIRAAPLLNKTSLVMAGCKTSFSFRNLIRWSRILPPPHLYFPRKLRIPLCQALSLKALAIFYYLCFAVSAELTLQTM